MLYLSSIKDELGMTILKNIRKIKTNIVFLILGCGILILFLVLVNVNYLLHLRADAIFKTFSNDCSYETLFYVSKRTEKIKLFDSGNYHLYGYGIKGVGISYHGVTKNLKEVLKTDNLSWNAFLKNFKLVYETEDKTIKKYAWNHVEIVLNKIQENYIEMLLIEKGKNK